MNLTKSGEADFTDREYLFTTQKRRMSYDFFRKKISECADMAAVKFHPHMARHTYAMELIQGGMDIIYVSKLLGHEDLETTARYTHPQQLEAIEKARKIDIFRPRVHKPVELDGMDRWGTEASIQGVTEPMFLLFFNEAISSPLMEVHKVAAPF